MRGVTAIDSSFRYGDLKRAIEGRVKEVLVPFIEQYNMGGYAVKLDDVLSQIVEQTALADNKRILENFRGLMVEPPTKTVTLEEVFERYCGFVQRSIDTDGLEIVFDDEPHYECVTACAQIEMDERFLRNSLFEYATLSLWARDDDEALPFAVKLVRWKEDRANGFDIRYDRAPTLAGLSTMSDFEVYLTALSRACTKLTWDKGMLDKEVQPDAEPEAEWR